MWRVRRPVSSRRGKNGRSASPVGASRRVALSLLALTIVSACGFRPRGDGLDGGFVDRSVYLDVDEDISVAAGVRQALAARDVRLVDSEDDAEVLLRIADERIDDRILSIQSTGRISEIELSHSVALLVRTLEPNDGEDANAEAALRNRVELLREYTYDDAGVLGKEEEERILREEMRETLVRQILLRANANLASIAADRQVAPTP